LTQHTPTPEQAAILALAREPDSIIIHALAGAAKTTTLVMLAAKLPVVSTFCGAFNKSIATEMGKRLPSHIESSTMNAVGHRAWGKKTGKRLNVSTDKMYSILSEVTGHPKWRPEDKKTLGANFSSMLRATRLAKSYGYIPSEMKSVGTSVMTADDFYYSLGAQIDCDADLMFQEVVDQALIVSIAQAFEGKIDFDDQIYMSTLFGGEFTKYEILMVDEAQDLSTLNHLMLSAMFSRRIIAVGDPFQSIYAFRGANTSSMDLLTERFSMRRMDLSVSFRCPVKVVERARTRAPAMQYPTWAKEGIVERLAEWSANTIPDGAMVICRNNAPLLRCAMYLIRNKRGIKLVGFDIGKNLTSVMLKLGEKTMPTEEGLEALKTWETTSIAKASESRHAAISDRAECMRVFISSTATLEEAVAFAQMIFNASGPIQLMTGHKSKGLEAPIVFHLDPWRVPGKKAIQIAESSGDTSQLEQEKNLRYVIETRAMDSLYLINMDDAV